ncbi:hypothetical protein [Streptomyces sp. NPDC001422]|uniref:hypothetical protein n=1 Tax=Streptomyces sp. NPDC001422 TaxID=3364575 RepID=UPI0036AC0B80
MSARRQLIAALSEDGLGGIATLHDVERAEKLVDAAVAEAVAAELRAVAADLENRVRAGGPRARGLAFARAIVIARAEGESVDSPRKFANHYAAAEKLRAQPGVWLPVHDYALKGSADAIARHIRCAVLPAYRPEGAFKARIEPTPDGYRVVACFVETTRKDVRP